MKNIEVTYLKAEIRSGKSEGLSSEEVLKLKDDINVILKDIPTACMSQMVRSWHCFRLENSSYWTALQNDKFMVDSSILNDIIHPETNT